MLKIRPSLIELQPYRAEGEEKKIRLDANECAGGLPPEVQTEIANALGRIDLHRYPDILMSDLRKEIAAEFSLSAEHIMIGSGSSELLQAICHVFGGADCTIVFPSPSFSMYGIYVRLSDSQGEAVSLEADYSLQAAKVIEAANRTQASLVLLCNPNNPTGTVMPQADIEAILQGVDCPVLVDEAYYEYYGQSSVNLLARYPRLIITRTFSKAYGLAGARVGYMIAQPEMIAAVHKVLMPYHVNALSLAAAGIVYANRQAFVAGIQETKAERARLTAALLKMPGVTVHQSEANFILLRVGNAGDLNRLLESRSISIRNFGQAPGLCDCLRVTIGTPAENDAFLQAVIDFCHSDKVVV